MKLITVNRTPENTKAFAAVFEKPNGKQKTVRFGTSSNYVLNPNKTDADRDAYRARHKVRENWKDPTTPGALSRYLLWGESRKLKKNLKAFRVKFNV